MKHSIKQYLIITLFAITIVFTTSTQQAKAAVGTLTDIINYSKSKWNSPVPKAGTAIGTVCNGTTTDSGGCDATCPVSIAGSSTTSVDGSSTGKISCNQTGYVANEPAYTCPSTGGALTGTLPTCNRIDKKLIFLSSISPYTVPLGYTHVNYIVVGGGGGALNDSYAGSGGGAGGYASGTIILNSDNRQFTLTIGVGGAGGSGNVNNSSSGTATSLNNATIIATAYGGVGGSGGRSDSCSATGGSGGSGGSGVTGGSGGKVWGDDGGGGGGGICNASAIDYCQSSDQHNYGGDGKEHNCNQDFSELEDKDGNPVPVGTVGSGGGGDDSSNSSRAPKNTTLIGSGGSGPGYFGGNGGDGRLGGGGGGAAGGGVTTSTSNISFTGGSGGNGFVILKLYNN